MNKPPVHPKIKKHRRAYRACTLVATALWAGAVLTAVLPYALWTNGTIQEEVAEVIVGVSFPIPLVAGFGAILFTCKAWVEYNDYRWEIDQHEWHDYHTEQKRIEKLMREEGLT